MPCERAAEDRLARRASSRPQFAVTAIDRLIVSPCEGMVGPSTTWSAPKLGRLHEAAAPALVGKDVAVEIAEIGAGGSAIAL